MKSKERRLTDEQSQLVADNMGLAYRVARLRTRSLPWLEDEILDGAIDGLIRAALLFDPSLGFKFSTLAWNAIRHGVESRLKWIRRRPLLVAFDESACDIGTLDELLWEDRQADDSADFEAVIARLGTRDRQILRMRYREGMTLKGVGDRLGFTREYVRQLQEKAEAKLRETMVA